MAEFGFDTISAEDIEMLRNAFTSKGMTGCLAYIEKKKDEWKSVPLKLGVIGLTGVGKSSFINTIRGLRYGDEGAALVGVVESTKDLTEYSYPNNEQFKLWDIPGVGTQLFPQATYLKRIGIDRYDCFVIITATRFTELDVWLAKEIVKRKKHFYFVRTKIDDDLRHEKHDMGRNYKEADSLQKIRNHTTECLKKENYDNQVFLIDNHHRTKYDFDELEETIINDLPNLKRQAMILSLSVSTKSMIKAKAEELRKRAWYAAVSSAAVAALPIPGVSIAFDSALLTTELKIYFQQLGLDDDSLIRRAQLMSVDYEKLKEYVSSEFPNEIGLQLLKSLSSVGSYAASMVFEEAARFIPFIGAIISAPISLAFTKFVLNSMLDKMEQTSLKLTEYQSSYDFDDD